MHKIGFDEEENPDKITVTMSVREAAFIAKVLGGFNGDRAELIQRDGPEVVGEIYSCLTGGFFNRFWDGGVKDVI